MAENPRFVTAGEMTAREIASLTPSDRPTNATEGMIYSDKNDHHLYFYTGTEWKALDVEGAPSTNGGGPPLFGEIADKQVAFGNADRIAGSDALQFESSEGVLKTLAVVIQPYEQTRAREIPYEGMLAYSGAAHTLYLYNGTQWIALN